MIYLASPHYIAGNILDTLAHRLSTLCFSSLLSVVSYPHARRRRCRRRSRGSSSRCSAADSTTGTQKSTITELKRRLFGEGLHESDEEKQRARSAPADQSYDTAVRPEELEPRSACCLRPEACGDRFWHIAHRRLERGREVAAGTGITPGL